MHLLASSYNALLATLPFFPSRVAAALNPSCRPGGNFDLSKWALETPIDNGNGQPLVISAASLSAGNDGCKNGWQDKGSNHQWFFTESTDGSMVMKAPGYSKDHPCIKWSGSNHCRTEFRETSPTSWPPSATTNRLHVKLVGIRGRNVCIGQVFQVGSSANKPFAELYYHDDGTVVIGVATCQGGANDGCDQDMQPLGVVALGTAFTYDIWFEGNVLKAGVNGQMKTLKTYFTTPGAMFKVGNYNQGTDDASVHILELTTQHDGKKSSDL
ncbi:alginate lyase 2 [Lasiosphaeris hirsuta]|uniref:Alginate lyase 2 n=1 Tax=Lasiosphaeris hirsuta TaxID=260670 RepID=A0AA40AA72_9PEZI|nr:alginate lyase 2 [Lasiosphaeris hirsuta]